MFKQMFTMYPTTLTNVTLMYVPKNNNKSLPAKINKKKSEMKLSLNRTVRISKFTNHDAASKFYSL